MDRAQASERSVTGLPRPGRCGARVVLLDKPVGPTSFDMVRAARRGTRGRVGHAGTLDPFATGLLLIMVGSATRISSLLMGMPKEYDLLVQFGAVSSTGDPTGESPRTASGTPAPEPTAPRGRPADRAQKVTAREVVVALDQFQRPHHPAGSAHLRGEGRWRASVQEGPPRGERGHPGAGGHGVRPHAG